MTGVAREGVNVWKRGGARRGAREMNDAKTPTGGLRTCAAVSRKRLL